MRLIRVLTIVGLTLSLSSLGVWASETYRNSFLPNVGDIDIDEEAPLGDMWTFNCPAGGHVSIEVDTQDDSDQGRARIDPLMFLVDGQGNLVASADDNMDCTYEPICGFACPELDHISCGTGLRHSIIVRDFGTATTNNRRCRFGGGYTLEIEVHDSQGNRLVGDDLGLGGGPLRSVPDWALDTFIAPVGPALDDEGVPYLTRPKRRRRR